MLSRRARRRDRRRCVATLTGGALFTLPGDGRLRPADAGVEIDLRQLLAVSPVGPQIRWWDPHLVDILFASRNGLFSWSPILYLGAIGLVLFAGAGRGSACPRSWRSR